MHLCEDEIHPEILQSSTRDNSRLEINIRQRSDFKSQGYKNYPPERRVDILYELMVHKKHLDEVTRTYGATYNSVRVMANVYKNNGGKSNKYGY